MIDFTNCPVNKFKGYGGANGNKINIIYEGQSYMLKFPPVSNKSKVMSKSSVQTLPLFMTVALAFTPNWMVAKCRRC